MWVHVNHGDEGLREWLRYVTSVSDSLLIEPQPWKCYKSAARRLRKLKCEPLPYMDQIMWRENVDTMIVNFLKDECGMMVAKDLGQNEWERSLIYMTRYT